MNQCSTMDLCGTLRSIKWCICLLNEGQNIFINYFEKSVTCVLFVLRLCFVCITTVFCLCYDCVLSVLRLCFVCVTTVFCLCYDCVLFVLRLSYNCVLFALCFACQQSSSSSSFPKSGRKCLTMSMGSGKMMVEFFSADMVLKVCGTLRTSIY